MKPKGTNPVCIALGGYDPWKRFPFIELHNGKVTFLPSKSMCDTFAITEAAFPTGAYLEYRIETGDRYVDGDRGQALGRSLWVVEPDGTRKVLAHGFVLYINLGRAALNLKDSGIPFKVMKVYDGPQGQRVETETTVNTSHFRLPPALLIGTSSLWLGAVAGIFIRNVWPVVAVGIVAFTVLAIATMHAGASKRLVFFPLISLLPTYAAGYALAVVLARYFMNR